jgi:CheY-like chemotaxis protein
MPKIRFIVEDTGIGIAPERLVEIFLPFHQIRDRHHRFEGTGLGLSISQKLIKLMGGELQVKSALGQGSTFWFDIELPEVTQGEETVEVSERTIVGFRGSQRKILIADEHWENRSILVSFLAPLGFDVAEASDGQACLEQALAWQPDAILLNPVLPVVNGLEVVRRIRQLPILQDVTILATSASVFDDYQQVCLTAGCDGFIPQPVQTQNLFEQLRKHLQLEWIYEESAQSVHLDASQTQPKSPADGFAPVPERCQEVIIAPPPAELGILYKLAMMGDIAGIIEQAERLERQDEQLIPFTRQLHKLARGFQEKQILEFVQKYMTDSP